MKKVLDLNWKTYQVRRISMSAEVSLGEDEGAKSEFLEDSQKQECQPDCHVSISVTIQNEVLHGCSYERIDETINVVALAYLDSQIIEETSHR